MDCFTIKECKLFVISPLNFQGQSIFKLKFITVICVLRKREKNNLFTYKFVFKKDFFVGKKYEKKI